MIDAINRCVRCNAWMPSFRVYSLCEECYAEEWQNDYDGEADYSDDTCPDCGGDGEVPDNGTNCGECDTCCGTGVVDW